MGKPRAVQDPAEAEAGRVQQLARNAATHQVREERAAPIRAAINQARNQIMTDTKASGLKGQELADSRAQALGAARTANRAQMAAPAAASSSNFSSMTANPVEATQVPMKNGGSVKYTDKSGQINLGSGRVSTHTPSKKSPNW